MSARPLSALLVELLECYGVEHVFGIPGVHTAELYRCLAGSNIRHITPRHEQGAGFMADAYARVNNAPGVCWIITGPGLSNIATAMLQARADSIPMLVITSVNDPQRASRGHLHEMPDQGAFARSVAIESHRIAKAADLVPAFASAFELFASKRPGPVHIEIPVSMMHADCSTLTASHGDLARPPVVAAQKIEHAITALKAAMRPVIIAGGGARGASSSLQGLANALGCPVVPTINARDQFPADWNLLVPASPSLNAVRELLEESDLVLAVGTEFGPTDFDMYETGQWPSLKHLIRVDICEQQLATNINAQLALVGDAAAVVGRILEGFSGDYAPQRDTGGPARVAQCRKHSWAELPEVYRTHIRFLEQIVDSAPDTLFVGDSTQLVYAANMYFAPGNAGRWFNSSVGFGTLGYALPAAIGAAIADTRPVLAIIGDGGIQYSLGELACLKESGRPVIVLIWNNSGFGEIKSFMLDNGIEPQGVDLMSPDFESIGHAFGLASKKLNSTVSALKLIKKTMEKRESLVIDLRVEH